MFQIVDFSSINDLKFTYVRLQFQIFFPGVIPRTPMIKGRGRERRGRKGGREGRTDERRGGEEREGMG
jgi:hypothetical protein